MERLKKIWNSLIKPKVWVAVTCGIVAMLIIIATVVLVIESVDNFIMYILYALSTLSLTYIIYLIVFFAPRIKKKYYEIMGRFEFSRHLANDFGFRSLFMVIVSFFINICHAGILLISAFLSKSIWFGSLAVYYLALSLIRGGVALRHKNRRHFKDKQDVLKSEIKSYRNCGIYILIITMALNVVIVQMVLSESFSYQGLLIYPVAAYTFYKLTFAIINIFKAKKITNYTTQAIRNVGLVDAVVSLLTLQTAMFSSFGGDAETLIPNAVTGTIVSLVILTIGIVMIINGNIKLKKLNGVNNGQR